MPPNNTTISVLRLVGEFGAPAYGMPVCAYTLEAARSLPEGQMILVVCHGMKGVNRVLAACAMRGVSVKHWKRDSPCPSGVSVAVAAVYDVVGLKAQVHTAIFEVYAGGEKQSIETWDQAFRIPKRKTLQRVGYWTKTHTIPTETEAEEDARASEQSLVMGVEHDCVRNEDDERDLVDRQGTRRQWGSKPTQTADLLVEQAFEETPDPHRPPRFSGPEFTQITVDARSLWAAHYRASWEHADILAWYGVAEFSDDAILNEAEHSGLTNRRMLHDERLSAELQVGELWSTDGVEGHSVNFSGRENPWLTASYLRAALAAGGLLDTVLGGQNVHATAVLSRAMGSALPAQGTAARADLIRILNLTVWSADQGGKACDPMLEGARTKLIRRVLLRCGYVFLHPMRRGGLWGPTVRGVTSGKVERQESEGFEAGGRYVYVETIAVSATPAETARKTAFNLTGGHTPRSAPPLQVWLKPGWREQAIPDSYSEEKRAHAEKGAAWLRRTAKAGQAPAPNQDWESLLLPSSAGFKAKKDSARVLSEATNIGRYFRGYVCAPEGQRFVNFDIQACHIRIARTLLRFVSASPFFDDMFAKGDVYTDFGHRFGMTREQAKTATLILLNGGGLGPEGLITIPGLDVPKTQEIYAAWIDNNNNPWWKARSTLVKKFGVHLPVANSLNSKVALLMQELENEVLQETVRRMRATKDVPVFRWAIPMYDGSLFLCAEADAPRLTEIAKACAEEACRQWKVDPVVHANHGATWAEAEGK